MGHPIRSARDAEQAALEYFLRLGHRDAHLTGSGADGGIDVEAAGLVVQVKAQADPTRNYQPRGTPETHKNRT